MKVALIFSGADSNANLAPYRSSPFADGLAREGFTPIVIDVDGTSGAGNPARPGHGIAGHRCGADELRAILPDENPTVIQTFGWASELGPVWASAAQTRVPLVHFVSSGGPVQDDVGLGLAWTRVRPKLASFAGWRARLASRQVTGVIGSNRADIGQHIELGFFPRAEFSVLAPPPVEVRESADTAPAAAIPTFGVYDPDATAHVLSFLAHVISLTGQAEFFSFSIAPARLRTLLPLAPAIMSFVDADSLDRFIGLIDVLVLPYCEDRMVPAVLAALKARKIVIVPDGGIASELIEYGRHGVLYAAGSAYHLAMAINIMAQSWKNRPLGFQGVEDVIVRLAPPEVARTFAAAYRKLAA